MSSHFDKKISESADKQVGELAESAIPQTPSTEDELLEKLEILRDELLSTVEQTSFNGEKIKQILKGIPTYGFEDLLGETILHDLAENNNPNAALAIQLILEDSRIYRKDIDINARDFNARTPLYYAAAAENPKGVRVLLRYGANPFFTDILGFDAEAAARIHGHLNVANEIHQRKKQLVQNDTEQVLFYLDRSRENKSFERDLQSPTNINNNQKPQHSSIPQSPVGGKAKK